MIPPRAALTMLHLYATGCLLVLGAVGYWHFGRGGELATHPRNPRYWQVLRSCERGRIIAADDTVLAVSEPRGGAQQAGRSRRVIFDRRYPTGDLCSHLVGYSDFRIGEAGVEMALNEQLLNLRAAAPARTDVTGLLWQALVPPPRRGNQVQLTIHAGLQRLAAAELGRRRGAVVALEVATGAVLCLVDYPRFDPNGVAQRWPELTRAESKPLLARAYQGLYPPGSVFKVLTAAAALQAGVVTPDTTFQCDGVKTLAHTRVACHVRSGHGRLTLHQAIAKSCNIALAETALRLGPAAFEQTLRAAALDARPALFFPGDDALGVVAKGRFPSGDDLTAEQLAACGYGQGELLVTPLWVASLGQALGNGGRRLEPRVVRRIDVPDGRPAYQLTVSPGQAVVDPATAATVLRMMRDVLRSGGTAAHLGLDGVTAAGKTGSAENPHGDAHSWFLALAPAEAPRVAVAALVENGGYGGRVAGPIAMTVLERALQVVQ